MAEINDLIRVIHGLLSRSIEQVHQHAITLDTYKEQLLRPLKYPEPNNASRNKVKSGRVERPNLGEIILDPEPDQRMALELSQEFNLDEVLCVELLTRAHDEWGAFTLQAAAGLFYAERLVWINAVTSLLENAAMNPYPEDSGSVGHPGLQVVRDFSIRLLAEKDGQRNILVGRLIDLLKETRLESSTGGIIEVQEQLGNVVPRASYVAHEKLALCRALLYACEVYPYLAPAVVTDMYDLLLSLAEKVSRAGPSPNHVLLLQAQLVLSSFMRVMLGVGTGDEGVARGAIRAIADDKDLKERMRAFLPPDGYAASARMAYGLMLAAEATSSGSRHSSGLAFLEQPAKVGAMRFLAEQLAGVWIKKEEQPVQQLVASTVYRTLVELLAPAYEGEVLVLLTKAAVRTSHPGHPAPEPSGPSTSLVLVGNAPARPSPSDDINSLLECLTRCFQLYPGLWYRRGDDSKREVVGRVLGRLAHDRSLKQNTEVAASFLNVLAALCVGQEGARYIIMQMHDSSSKPELEHMSWQKLIQVMVKLCDHFRPTIEQRGGLDAGRNMGGMASPDAVQGVNPKDVPLLEAFLRVFERILHEGHEQEVRLWLRGLEQVNTQVLAGAQLHEVFFQLMCYPVPNVLKAALDRVLCAWSRFPDVAKVFLQRLLECVVVAPESNGGPLVSMAGTRHDLSVQLNEIEAPQEDFPETLAFLRLMNQLISQFGEDQSLPGQGVYLQDYTHFVLQQVLAKWSLRSYKSEAQKWELVEASLEHLRIIILLLDFNADVRDLGAEPPGYMALANILSGKAAMQAVLKVLEPGHHDLELAQDQGDAGPAREAAVVAALSLLVAVMERDVPIVDLMMRRPGGARLRQLDVQLAVPRRLAMLLQYVCYSQARVQLPAIRLTILLAARVPELVRKLQDVSVYDDPEAEAIRVQAGFAQSLRGGLEVLTGHTYGNVDDRPALILDLLLSQLDNPSSPNMTHLLMGYDIHLEPDAVARSVLQVKQRFSCLSVIMETVVDERFCRLYPALYSRVLELLYRLAVDPLTSPPLKKLLIEDNAQLLTDLTGILFTPAQSNNLDLAAILRQKALVMKWQALMMLGTPSTSKLIEDLLKSLCAVGKSRISGLALELPQVISGTNRSALDYVLEELRKIRVHEPHFPAEYRTVLHDLVYPVANKEIPLDDMWRDNALMEQLGLMHMDPESGEMIYDFDVMQELLNNSLADYNNRGGIRGGAHESPQHRAVCALMEYCQLFNGYKMVTGGQKAVAEGWQQLVEVMFTKQYDAIPKVVGREAADVLYDFLMKVLDLLNSQGDSQTISITSSYLASWCDTLCTLLAKLQEQAHSSIGLPAEMPNDPLASVRSAANCRRLLQCLLGILVKFKALPEVRLHMYVAILQHMHLYQTGVQLTAESAHPVILQKLLQGLTSTGGSVQANGVRSGVYTTAPLALSAAQLDTAQAALQSVVRELLLKHKDTLMELLGTDCTAGRTTNSRGQAVALHLLGTLIAADPNQEFKAMALRDGILRVLLAVVKDDAGNVLLRPSHRGQGIYLLDAQLALLLRMAQSQVRATHPSLATKKVFDELTIIRDLAECSALDLIPEDPRFLHTVAPLASLRSRLHHLVAPVIRLVLAVAASFPDSGPVQEELKKFILQHHGMICRVMREVAVPENPQWQPGEVELEEAALVMSLLSRCSVLFSDFPTSEAFAVSSLKQGLTELWLTFCGRDTHSRSALVKRTDLLDMDEVMDDDEEPRPLAATLHDQRETRSDRLTLLRCGLVRLMRQMVQYGGAVLIYTGPEGQTRLDPKTGTCTLTLVRETVDQACEDLSEGLERLEQHLGLLERPDSQLSKEEVERSLREVGPPKLSVLALPEDVCRRVLRQACARAASRVLRRLTKLTYIMESCLAIIFLHFQRYLPSQPDEGAAVQDDGDAMMRDEDMAFMLPGEIGSSQQLALRNVMEAVELGTGPEQMFFTSRMRDTCRTVSRVLEDCKKLPALDMTTLEVLNRKLKLYLASL